MLFPLTHSWTRREKWLIVGCVVTALAIFGVSIYCYERYHRGPTDTVFVGTWAVAWRHPEVFDTADRPVSFYYEFRSDHTYQQFIIVPELAPHDRFIEENGTWHAGGDFLYLRPDLDEAPYMGLYPFHIDAMSPSEVKLHIGRGDVVLKRVMGDASTASNQAMERTADRSAPHF